MRTCFVTESDVDETREFIISVGRHISSSVTLKFRNCKISTGLVVNQNAFIIVFHCIGCLYIIIFSTIILDLIVL